MRAWSPTPFLRVSAAVHLASALGCLVWPSRWPLAAGAVFGNHVALAAAGMWPRSRLLGPNLSRLPGGGPAASSVALTFDDGPDPDTTPRVLDLLSVAGAPATFFCIGRKATEHPELIREISRRGHRLENHSFTHPNTFALLPPRALAREIDRAQETLTGLSGRTPGYFRAPAGLRSPWLEPLLAHRGLRLVSWTRRGFDAIDPNPRRVARRLLDGLVARDILLLHDAQPLVRRRSGGTVLEVLPRVLEALADKGLQPALLPESAPAPDLSE